MNEKNSWNILIVEDERIIAKDIERAIINLGYGIIGNVGSGKEAFRIIDSSKPDLVLMDIMLDGDIDGIDTAREIQKQYDIPVVYLTAYADEKTLVKAKQTGTFGYILKPFDDRELFATIEMAMFKSNMENRLRDSKKKIENLHSTARLLSSCESDKEVYEITVKAAEDILDFSMSSLYTYKDNNFTSEVKSILTDKNREYDFFDEFLARKTMDDHKTLFNNNLSNGISDKMNGKFPLSLISTPINERGVFQVVSTGAKSFGSEDIHLLELLIGHTTEALKRITLQETLKKQAIHDPLTGLYNRYFLRQAIEYEKRASKRYNHSIAFILIDINDLKEINDNYGHQVGDDAILTISDFLSNEARDADIVVRFGGDEFLIILPQTGEEVTHVKDRMNAKNLTWNNEVNTHPFQITYSIGSAFWNSSSDMTIEDVIALADKEMYKNKREQKRNRNEKK